MPGVRCARCSPKHLTQGVKVVSGYQSTGWGLFKPVKNAELWQRLDALRKLHQVEWRWVKGHAGDPGNERADALANLGVEQALGR